MTYNRDAAADLVLALMYLEVHDGSRAWKGYPWDVLDALHQRGLISDPKGKAKSVVLTDEGLDRAEAAFDRLLSDQIPAPERVRRDTPAASPSRLSELQTILVERSLAPLCAPDPDPEVSSQLRLGYRIENSSVILFESRPGFRPPHEWRDRDVAKFTFVNAAGVWRLFCQFRDLKWHAYEPLAESPNFSVLVAEVRTDPTGIFWG